MFIRFSQSARKHKIAKGRARFVMEHTTSITATREDGTTEVSWYGPDDRGLMVTVVGIIKTDRHTGEDMLLVIHVQPDYPQEKP